jgi:aspartate oxidase
MSTELGVIRHRAGLERAVAAFARLAPCNPAASLCLRIAQAALARPASLGAHAMRDDPTALSQAA